MKNVWRKTGKITLVQAKKRLCEEWVQFVEYGPFTPFGLKSAIACGLIGATLLGYTQAKRDDCGSRRRGDIAYGTAIGGVFGIMVGGLWPLVPVLGAWFVISRTIEVTTRKRQ